MFLFFFLKTGIHLVLSMTMLDAMVKMVMLKTLMILLLLSMMTIILKKNQQTIWREIQIIRKNRENPVRRSFSKTTPNTMDFRSCLQNYVLLPLKILLFPFPPPRPEIQIFPGISWTIYILLQNWKNKAEMVSGVRTHDHEPWKLLLVLVIQRQIQMQKWVLAALQ